MPALLDTGAVRPGVHSPSCLDAKRLLTEQAFGASAWLPFGTRRIARKTELATERDCAVSAGPPETQLASIVACRVQAWGDAALVPLVGAAEAFACGAVPAGQDQAVKVGDGEGAGPAWSVTGVPDGDEPGGEADTGAFGSWFASTLAGGSQPPEHIPLGLDAYPMAAQQGVWSAAYPWSTVVLVTTLFPNGMGQIGSGVLVGRNDVLTAAHIVYNPAFGGFASTVVATPAAVVGPPFQAPYGASFARISAADIDFDPNGDRLIQAGNRGLGLAGSERDIAFLTLDIPLGDWAGWMGLDPTFKQGYANLSGYPSVYGHVLTNDTAWAYDDTVDAFTNLYYFEAHTGNSGGPVWHYGSDGRPAVVGVVSSGNNGRALAALDIATYYPSIVGWIASNDPLIA